MESPFKPDISSENFDSKHVNNPNWVDASAVKDCEKELSKSDVQDLFRGYYYNKLETQIQNQSSPRKNDL